MLQQTSVSIIVKKSAISLSRLHRFKKLDQYIDSVRFNPRQYLILFFHNFHVQIKKNTLMSTVTLYNLSFFSFGQQFWGLRHSSDMNLQRIMSVSNGLYSQYCICRYLHRIMSVFNGLYIQNCMYRYFHKTLLRPPCDILV